MKTKLYTLITSLLMATCITSYGQEIVGEFTVNFSNSGFVETTDGSFIMGSINTDDVYEIYKLSPEGELLDDTILLGYTNSIPAILEIPSMPDRFIVASYRGYTSVCYLKFTVIDANLQVIHEATVSINMNGAWISGPFFVTPDETIIFSYADYNGEVYLQHFARYALDGTLLQNTTLTEIPYATDYPGSSSDTALYYTGFKVFSAEPLTFSCFGNYRTDATVHFVNNILDNDYHLIERVEYAPIDTYVYSNQSAEVIPFVQPEAMSHLLTAQCQIGPTIIKYDNEGLPIAFHRFTSSSNMFSLKTVIKDPNTIYYSYGSYSQFGPSQHLARLDNNLEVVWDFTIPCPSTQQNNIESIKILQNGDIAVGTQLWNTPSTPIGQVFIIHDGYDATPEIPATETPFSLYPNPVKDHLTLRFDDGTEPESVELYDLAGRLVGTKPNGLESIDMGAMPSGVYMLRVATKDGTSYHEKILKE